MLLKVRVLHSVVAVYALLVVVSGPCKRLVFLKRLHLAL
jgi:hypothetical protein